MHPHAPSYTPAAAHTHVCTRRLPLAPWSTPISKVCTCMLLFAHLLAPHRHVRRNYAPTCSLSHTCQLRTSNVCTFSFHFARLSAQLSHVCTRSRSIIASLTALYMPCVPQQAPSRTPTSSAQPGMNMHAPSRTSNSSAHSGMHPHAPSRTSYSSAQPSMHPHVPSRTHVSSAHAMRAPADSALVCELSANVNSGREQCRSATATSTETAPDIG
eukprot:6018340-Pyramimonas_sp.AAC.1